MAKQTIHPLGAEADYETALKEIERYFVSSRTSGDHCATWMSKKYQQSRRAVVAVARKCRYR
jgi:hypothetical protein